MLKFLIIFYIFFEFHNIEAENKNLFCESINNMCDFKNKVNDSISGNNSNDALQQLKTGIEL